MFDMKPQILPDVANSQLTALDSRELEWVGMEDIRLPLQVRDSEGQWSRTEVSLNAFVNLVQKEARGIHMSRLYSRVQQNLANKNLSFSSLHETATDFLATHSGLSDMAKIEVQFSAFVSKRALKSDLQAWRTYPVRMVCVKSADSNDKTNNYFLIETEILYSSTCPASAALSRRLIQDEFFKQMSETLLGDLSSQEKLQRAYDYLGTSQGLAATPHAQRSLARVQAKVTEGFDIFQLIELVESALGTPVQTIVKREDEQEFARLNAKNLMFCEDAARRIQKALTEDSGILDFLGRVSHQESLHPHNAVATFHRMMHEKK